MSHWFFLRQTWVTLFLRYCNLLVAISKRTDSSWLDKARLSSQDIATLSSEIESLNSRLMSIELLTQQFISAHVIHVLLFGCPKAAERSIQGPIKLRLGCVRSMISAASNLNRFQGRWDILPNRHLHPFEKMSSVNFFRFWNSSRGNIQIFKSIISKLTFEDSVGLFSFSLVDWDTWIKILYQLLSTPCTFWTTIKQCVCFDHLISSSSLERDWNNGQGLSLESISSRITSACDSCESAWSIRRASFATRALAGVTSCTIFVLCSPLRFSIFTHKPS